MLSKLIRRSHMYLALFLTPWMVGYAASTLLMNHAAGRPVVFVSESERPYNTSFEPGTPPRVVAEQILSELDLEGTFGVAAPSPDGKLTITRQDIVAPRRVTFYPTEQRLTVERAQPDAVGFLYRFHRRRGYEPPYLADRAMAFSVDLVIAAMVFWALSGLWMWWEMRATRRWGLACAILGVGIFTFFALTI
jgi:hypothetical protein